MNSAHPFVLSNSSICSGRHRYVGDASLFELRLIFTEDDFLTTRPIIVSKTKNQGHQKESGKQEKENEKQKGFSDLGFKTMMNNSSLSEQNKLYSSYLLCKQADEWVIKTELDLLCLRENGFELKVIREPLSLNMNDSKQPDFETNIFNVLDDAGKQNINQNNRTTTAAAAALKQETAPGLRKGKEETSQRSDIDIVARSKRDFNWKDTTTVTSDNVGTHRRTLARKLPYEICNHLKHYHSNGSLSHKHSVHVRRVDNNTNTSDNNAKTIKTTTEEESEGEESEDRDLACVNCATAYNICGKLSIEKKTSTSTTTNNNNNNNNDTKRGSLPSSEAALSKEAIMTTTTTTTTNDIAASKSTKKEDAYNEHDDDDDDDDDDECLDGSDFNYNLLADKRKTFDTNFSDWYQSWLLNRKRYIIVSDDDFNNDQSSTPTSCVTQAPAGAHYNGINCKELVGDHVKMASREEEEDDDDDDKNGVIIDDNVDNFIKHSVNSIHNANSVQLTMGKKDSLAATTVLSNKPKLNNTAIIDNSSKKIDNNFKQLDDSVFNAKKPNTTNSKASVAKSIDEINKQWRIFEADKEKSSSSSLSHKRASRSNSLFDGSSINKMESNVAGDILYIIMEKNDTIKTNLPLTKACRRPGESFFGASSSKTSIQGGKGENNEGNILASNSNDNNNNNNNRLNLTIDKVDKLDMEATRILSSQQKFATTTKENLVNMVEKGEGEEEEEVVIKKEGGESKVQKLALDDSGIVSGSTTSATSTSLIKVLDSTASSSSLSFPLVSESDSKGTQEPTKDKTVGISDSYNNNYNYKYDNNNNNNNDNNNDMMMMLMNRTSSNKTMMAKINSTRETTSSLLVQSDEIAATSSRMLESNTMGAYESSDKGRNKNDNNIYDNNNNNTNCNQYDRNQMTLTSAYNNDNNNNNTNNHKESISFEMQQQQQQQQRQTAFILLQQLRRRGCWLNSYDTKVVCLAVIVIDVLNRFIQLKPDLNNLISLDSRSTKLLSVSTSAKANTTNEVDDDDNVNGNKTINDNNNLLTSYHSSNSISISNGYSLGGAGAGAQATTNNISIKETRDGLNEQREQDEILFNGIVVNSNDYKNVSDNSNTFHCSPSTLKLLNQNQTIVVPNERIIQRPLIYQLQLKQPLTALARAPTDKQYGVSRLLAEHRLALTYKYLAPPVIVNNNKQATKMSYLTSSSPPPASAPVVGDKKARVFKDKFCRKEAPPTVVNKHSLLPSDGFLTPMNGNVFVNVQFDIHFASDFPKDCNNLYIKYKLMIKTKANSLWKLRRRRRRRHSGTTKTLRQPNELSKNVPHNLIQMKADKSLVDGGSSLIEADARRNNDDNNMTTNDDDDDDDDDDERLYVEEKKKLAQLSHSSVVNELQWGCNTSGRTSNATKADNNPGVSNEISSKISLDFADKNSKKPGTNLDHDDQQIFALKVDSNKSGVVHEQEQTLLDPSKTTSDINVANVKDDDDDDELTSILESSTLTSHRNSKGLFHFSCAEQLMLEFEYYSRFKEADGKEQKFDYKTRREEHEMKLHCLNDTLRRQTKPLLAEHMVSSQQETTTTTTTTTTFDCDRQSNMDTYTIAQQSTIKHVDNNYNDTSSNVTTPNDNLRSKTGARSISRNESQLAINTKDEGDANAHQMFAYGVSSDRDDLTDYKADNQSIECNIPTTMYNKQNSSNSKHEQGEGNSGGSSSNNIKFDDDDDDDAPSLEKRDFLVTSFVDNSTNYNQSSERGFNVDKKNNNNNNLSSNKHSTLLDGTKLNSYDDNFHVNDNDQKISNGDCEIILLLEFYSSDFYHDKLQGWSYLNMPICLDQNLSKSKSNASTEAPTAGATTNTDVGHFELSSRIDNNIYKSSTYDCDHVETREKCACTGYHLAVIRPELGSIMDKLRYYLISELPKSTPKLRNVSA